MGFWEQLPYTNFHNLNLSELVKFVNATIARINEMSHSIEEQNQNIEDFKTYVMDYLNNLNVTQDVRDYIDELITNGTMRDIVDIASRTVNVDWTNRKALFLGDSYMTGWYPGGWASPTFVDTIANILKLGEYWNYSDGGTGFSYARPRHYLELFTNFTVDHPDKTPTDIFIMGGYNDNTETASDIIDSNVNPYNGYKTIDAMKTAFPDALIHIAYIGRGAGNNLPRSELSTINKTAVYYQTIANYRQCHYIPNCEVWLHDYRGLGTDGIHPNQSGHDQIGLYCAETLLYGYFQYANIGNWHRMECEHTTAGTDCTQLAPAFGSFPIFEQLTNEGVIIQGRNALLSFYGTPLTDVSFHGYRARSICLGKYTGSDNCRNFISNFGSTNDIAIPMTVNMLADIGNGFETLQVPCALTFEENGALTIRAMLASSSFNYLEHVQVGAFILPAFEYTIPLNAC